MSAAESTEEGAEYTLKCEDVHDLLRNSRRESLIQRLHHIERSGAEGVTVQTVSAAIAADEEGVAIEDVTTEQRRRVYISLTQTHIPRLESRDVLTDVQQLKPGPNLPKVVAAMDAVALVINPDRIVGDLTGDSQ